MMRYGSAHFIWDNEFRNIDNFEVMLDYNGKRSFNVKAVLNYYTGYTYFDAMALPRQLTDQLLVGSIFIDKSFSWGGFNHRHQILLQKPTSDMIHLPLLAYGNTTYYQNAFFNNELKFQLGWDFTYTDRFYGDAYMPATGIFYNQHEEKIGQFPFLDAFVNLKIKRTRFTFQYTNALAGLAGTDYFKAYRYPTFGARFKFGLAWTFYN